MAFSWPGKAIQGVAVRSWAGVATYTPDHDAKEKKYRGKEFEEEEELETDREMKNTVIKKQLFSTDTKKQTVPKSFKIQTENKINKQLEA